MAEVVDIFGKLKGFGGGGDQVEGLNEAEESDSSQVRRWIIPLHKKGKVSTHQSSSLCPTEVVNYVLFQTSDKESDHPVWGYFRLFLRFGQALGWLYIKKK